MNSETAKAYRSLAAHFYATRLPGVPEDQLNDLNIIGELLRAATEYRPDYFRRLRNALAHDQETRGNFGIAHEINRTLNPVTVLGLKKKAKRRLPRGISDDDLQRWLHQLTENGLLVEAGALLLVTMTGARPCELGGIRVIGNRILIPGAKRSHGGLRGADRILEASTDYCSWVRNAVGAFHSEPKSLDAIRMGIRAVAKQVFGEKKAPSMYTLRHQFGANLKATGMSRKAMAYIMGHQSTDSLARYGNKRWGRAEAIQVRPAVDADMSNIRKTHEYRPSVRSKEAKMMR